MFVQCRGGKFDGREVRIDGTEVAMLIFTESGCEKSNRIMNFINDCIITPDDYERYRVKTDADGQIYLEVAEPLS